MYKPKDHEIAKVMEETGMDWIQAYHHLQQRARLEELSRPYSGQRSGPVFRDNPSGDPYDTINS